MTILVSAAVAVLLAAGTAWGQDALPAEDQLGEAPLAGTEPVTTFVPGEVVVKTVADEYEIRQVDAASLNAVREAAAEIEARDPSVEEAGLNWVYYPEFVPDDPRYDQQDWLRAIRAPGAWDISRGSGVRIGVVDTGWQVGKADLVANLGGQYDFVAEDAEAEGYDYHGTSVAGIAAADTNNGRGVASIGFDARFVMAKACTDRCLTADIAQAIEWLVQTQDVKILNLSFGVTYSNGVIDPILRDAIRGALDAGALVVASAGNTGDHTNNHYPSCFEWNEGDTAYNAETMNEVLGVGAVNDAGTKADFSNTGPCVDLVAPGESVLTTFDVNDPTLPEASYAYVNGTSFSAPQVAGTAALISAQNPALGAEQIAARLQSQAMDRGEPGRDDAYGYGLLNARCSVNPYITGCNPIVSSVGPPDGATEVAVATNVRATFSEAMDAQTINARTFELTEQGSSAPIAAAVSYGAKTKKATLNPNADLEPQTTYTATVKGGANGAKDAAGNALATDKVWSFTTAAPPDTTAPETTIDSGPTGTVNNGSATFEFSSSEANSTLECSLDGAVFSTCFSPQQYAGLAEGSHTFEVRATDAAGNTDASPASRSWTVDTVAPVVTIDSKPAALTNDTNASFGFSSEEADSTFECSLSQGAQPEAFVPCSSPKSYAPLTEGTYTFKVKATDVAGNTGAPASYSFEVDTTKPAAPSKPDLAAKSDSGASDTDDVTNDNTPTLTGSAEANSTVALFLLAEGTSLGTAAANATGDYSLTVASDKALTDGTYSVTAKATDGAGNTSAASNARTVIVDSTPPETTIDSGPSGTVNSTSASFEFSSSEAGSSFECKLDDGAFSACTSPKEYVGNLSDGPHTFYVKAMDAAGNTDSTPAERSWSVDTVAPNPPVITTPADNSYNNTASVTFSGTAEPNSTVEVFDGTTPGGTTQADLGGVWSKELTGVTDGSHTYTAKATDTTGNVSAASNARTVTVDTKAPETTIDSGPSGTVNSTSASFSFSSSEANSAFRCSLDGSAFESCTSPEDYDNLAEGQHTFEVKAVDAAGNVDLTPASRAWTVDTTAPTVGSVTPEDGATNVSVDANVEAVFSEEMNPSTLTVSTFTLLKEGTATPVTAAVSYDAANKKAVLNPGADLDTNATYTATVKGGAGSAEDVAGNPLGADKTWSFTTPDTTPPNAPTVDLATESDTGASDADDLTKDNTPTFGGDAEAGSKVSIYDGTALLGTVDATGAGRYSFTVADTDMLGDGTHAITAKATDVAGNVSIASAELNVRIDTEAPDVAITSGPEGTVNSGLATFAFSSSEPDSTFECGLDGGAFSSCASPKEYTGLAEGSHTFEVRAIDAAGNIDPTPASRAWMVDTTPADTTLSSGPEGPTNDDTPTFGFGGTDNTTATAELVYSHKLDSGDWSGYSGETSVTLGGVDGLSEGIHTFYVKAKDRAGLEDGSPAERSFTVDKTPPETTIDSGPTDIVNSTSATLAFSSEANAAYECSLDGVAFETCTSPKNYTSLADGQHTFRVRATDAAGNTDSTPAEQSWSVDTTAPMVASVTPQDGATNVALGTNVEATFSEAMDKATVEANGTFELVEHASTTPVAATVSYDDATKTATLNPDADLKAGTTYVVTIKGGADGARDVAGNALTADMVWSFTATAQPETTP